MPFKKALHQQEGDPNRAGMMAVGFSRSSASGKSKSELSFFMAETKFLTEDDYSMK